LFNCKRTTETKTKAKAKLNFRNQLPNTKPDHPNHGEKTKAEANSNKQRFKSEFNYNHAFDSVSRSADKLLMHWRSICHPVMKQKESAPIHGTGNEIIDMVREFYSLAQSAISVSVDSSSSVITASSTDQSESSSSDPRSSSPSKSGPE
jgi:hypothetical protein